MPVNETKNNTLGFRGVTGGHGEFVFLKNVSPHKDLGSVIGSALKRIEDNYYKVSPAQKSLYKLKYNNCWSVPMRTKLMLYNSLVFHVLLHSCQL